jgi:hypothetical protein
MSLSSHLRPHIPRGPGMFSFDPLAGNIRHEVDQLIDRHQFLRSMLTGPARRERSRGTVPRRTCRWRNERVCSRSSHPSIASTCVQAQRKTRIGAWVINRQSLPSNLDNSSRSQKSSRSIPAVSPLNRSASSAISSAIAIGSGNKLDWIVSTKVLKRLPHTSSRLCSHPAADAKARAVGGQAEAEHQQAASRAQGLSVSSARQDDRPAEPGVGC